MRTIKISALPVWLRSHWKQALVATVIGVAIVAGAVYFAVFYVAKSDYSHTLTKVNQSVTVYNKLLSARDDVRAAIPLSDKAFSDALTSYTQDSHDYNSSITALATERSLKNSTVRSSYDALMKKNDVFMQYTKTQLTLLPLFHHVDASCTESSLGKLNISDLGKIVDAYDSATKPCLDAMRSLVASKVPIVVTRGSAAVDYFSTMRTHAVAMQAAYLAGNRAGFESEYNVFLEAVANYKANVAIDSLLGIDTTVVPTTQLNNFASILASYQK